MAMSTHRSRNAVFVICIALLMGSLFSAGWAFQGRGSRPASQDDRRRLLENLMRQAQPNKQNAGQGQTQPAPAPAMPQQPAAPSPASPAAPAPPSPSPPASGSGQRMVLNYEGVDLGDFINQTASALGLNPLIIDSEVKGTVTVVSSTPMSREEVFPLFSMILKNNNAALIKQNGIYQIIPMSSALKRGVEIIERLPEPSTAKPESELPLPGPGAGAGPAGSMLDAFRNMAAARAGTATPAPAGTPAPARTPAATSTETGASSGTPRLATHVIRVEFVPVKDLIEPIRLFMTDGGVIMPYERLNMLILTDYTDSADRILQIIRMLDNNFLDPDLVELVKINHNSSSDIVDDLKKIFGSGAKDSPTGVSFVSLDRLNVIFVIASSKRGLTEIKGWIEKLDASSGKKVQTFIYVVQNSTASNIAMLLSALYGGDENTGTGQEAAGTTGAGGVGPAAGVGGRSQARGGQGGALGGQGSYTSPFSNQSAFGNSLYNTGAYGGGLMGGGAIGSGQMLGPQLNVTRQITSQVLRGGEFTGLQDTVRMVVDDINNSLIIQAAPGDYEMIAETIKKMDVLPRQALIDARVFEVDLTDNLSFGVAAALQEAGATGKSADHSTGASLNNAGSLVANTFAFVGNSRELLLKLNALRLKTKVKILEAPSVLALDGTAASITVGAEIPYPAGGFTSTGGSTTQVQYRKTGVTLLVLPRISASGSVTLDITHEVSSPGAVVPVGSGENATSFNLTTVTNTFSVRDGETVAIAGLIRESKDFSRSGIPFLSEIPVLGALFGQTTRNGNRTELIILITPHVIKTVEKSQEMTQELKDSLRHVRTMADEHEKERMRDVEEAREDRYKQEQKSVKEAKPAEQAMPARQETLEKAEKPEQPKVPETPPKSVTPAKPEEPKKPN